MGKVSEDFLRKYPYDCHYSDDYRNIGNLKQYGNVNTILFSPPFPNANTGGSLDNLKEIKMSDKCAKKFSNDKNNIDNVKTYGDVDKVIFSPPFSSVVGFQDKNIAKWRRNGKKSNAYDKYLSNNKYSKDKNNVGRNSGASYWDMMYKIYYGCYKVLRKGGTMVVHTKNYVRSGKQVMLNEDTIRVCESMGFRITPCPKCGIGGHTHRRVIDNPSAWINIRVKRGVDEGKSLESCPYNIRHEDILVFRK